MKVTYQQFLDIFLKLKKDGVAVQDAPIDVQLDMTQEYDKKDLFAALNEAYKDAMPDMEEPMYHPEDSYDDATEDDYFRDKPRMSW